MVRKDFGVENITRLVNQKRLDFATMHCAEKRKINAPGEGKPASLRSSRILNPITTAAARGTRGCRSGRATRLPQPAAAASDRNVRSASPAARPRMARRSKAGRARGAPENG